MTKSLNRQFSEKEKQIPRHNAMQCTIYMYMCLYIYAHSSNHVSEIQLILFIKVNSWQAVWQYV